MSFPEPRAFQVTARERLREGVRQGHDKQILMAPTGAGKTMTALWIADGAIKKGARVLFVADRTTLISQTSSTADGYGMNDHGIIQAQHWRTNLSRPFQIASVQTLARRSWPEADLVIIDEVHAQYSAWVEYVKETKAKVIGLSATPFSVGLGKLFTNLVNAATMHELTEQGILVPMRHFIAKKADMSGAATAGGEWTDKAAEERGLEIVGDVVSEWARHGEGRKTICFGATIRHCEELCRQFNEAGISAAVFTSNTSADEREMLLREYRKEDSHLRVLISVEALAKGFDVPDVGCVIDCRPLRKSLSTAIQMWGRGLRSSPGTGKQDCIILDHAGNLERFAEDFSDIFYNGLGELNDGEKLDKAIRRDEDKPAKPCPKCGAKPFVKRCFSCGFEAQTTALVEHFPGELSEVKIGKRKLADDARHLYEQCVTYAREHSAPEKQKARAAFIYKDIMGQFPPRSFAFDATPNVPITRAVLNQIRAKNIQYAHRRQQEAA